MHRHIYWTVSQNVFRLYLEAVQLRTGLEKSSQHCNLPQAEESLKIQVCSQSWPSIARTRARRSAEAAMPPEAGGLPCSKAAVGLSERRRRLLFLRLLRCSLPVSVLAPSESCSLPRRLEWRDRFWRLFLLLRSLLVPRSGLPCSAPEASVRGRLWEGRLLLCSLVLCLSGLACSSPDVSKRWLERGRCLWRLCLRCSRSRILSLLLLRRRLGETSTGASGSAWAKRKILLP